MGGGIDVGSSSVVFFDTTILLCGYLTQPCDELGSSSVFATLRGSDIGPTSGPKSSHLIGAQLVWPLGDQSEKEVGAKTGSCCRWLQFYQGWKTSLEKKEVWKEEQEPEAALVSG